MNRKPELFEIASVDLPLKSIDQQLDKEWLLTNRRGGYTSSSIVGCNTRRYHGLLVGSLNPPVDRIVALANCMEIITCNDKVYNLSTFEFSDRISPSGYNYLKRFRQDIGAHFDYQLGSLELTKSVYLFDDSDTVAIQYDFTSVDKPLEFVTRPFVSLRDFHSLQKSYAPLNWNWHQDGLLIRHDTANSCELFVSCPSMEFENDQQWWYNFVYRKDKERGQSFNEDLWTPGFFKCKVDSPCRIILWANFADHCHPETLVRDIDIVRQNLQTHQESLTALIKKDDTLKKLYLAADQFITKRNISKGQTYTILAGFPWFADWGRDAFIALPGLLLQTGRFQQAHSVLTTFASFADQGMIPNRFDDHADMVHFNSIDASLWFINAAFQYLATSGDDKGFQKDILPAALSIIDAYYNGTRFGIHADSDSLITGGDYNTQLTWMDAKFGNTAFTPRFGKAVEINALWYNALCLMARYYVDSDIKAASHYHTLADKVQQSFCKLFWNNETKYLNDCILPDGLADTSLRPNQIFAVSLDFSPLPLDQQKAVVQVVQDHLLTPYGLRTLSKGDSRYKGTYTGPQQYRDAAYHQGTVWPYLIGHFIEAFLKVNDFSKESTTTAAGFIEPLLQHLTSSGCLGSVSEIFDGDLPHWPKGCFAQAWSVAELLRAYKMINR